MAQFCHPKYTLVDGDSIVRVQDGSKPSRSEDEEILREVARYVESSMILDHGFVSIPIPDEEAEISTNILASADWETNSKLLIMIHSGAGYPMGIFSRSIVMDQGLSKGSMLPYVVRARAAGYAVMILRPNANYVEGQDGKRIKIEGSETPEIHAIGVWDSLISRCDAIKHVALLGFGSGASLCKEIFVRQMVRTKNDGTDENRIKAFVTVEASRIIDDDDGSDLKLVFKDLAINLESSTAPMGYRLEYLKKKFHNITTISVGLPVGLTAETKHANATYAWAMDTVFKYLQTAEAGGPVSHSFAKRIAIDNGHDPVSAAVKINPNNDEEDIGSSTKSLGGVASASSGIGMSSAASSSSSSSTSEKVGIFYKLQSFFGGNKKKEEWDQGLSVDDFEYLKVVGRGAFGKVMQVRKKSSGAIYAMKILKKVDVIAKGQVEHTMAEKEILSIVNHPFIVRLRFSFQTKEKLYIITDYYNGGSLFFHLRKTRQFSEERSKFYAAELLSGLAHLHSQNIIYRDLKLENVLMDHLGHIAITDFGLSKQDIDKSGGATTFCGTAEYIAPELLQNKPYGPGVDWWSFGIILFEMVQGTTPFYNKNRKYMFQCIARKDPSFPTTFSPALCEVIRGLLTKDVSSRLGCGAGGARDIMNSAFFSTIDFAKLDRKEISPPFKPDVVDELDTKYVPSSIQNAEAKESFAEAPSKKAGAQVDFGGFTYSGEE